MANLAVQLSELSSLLRFISLLALIAELLIAVYLTPGSYSMPL